MFWHVCVGGGDEDQGILFFFLLIDVKEELKFSIMIAII
jgi:hypothetical protein